MAEEIDVRFTDGQAESSDSAIDLIDPSQRSTVTAMAWSPSGILFAVATQKPKKRIRG